MRNIEIVGGLVQKQDVRFLQQKLTQKYLSTLTTGQLGNILVQTDFGKPEGAAKPAENAPQQPAEPRRRPDAQEQPKSEGRSSRRGRSRRRSGGEGAARPAAQPQQKSPQPKQPRPQRPAPQAEAAGEQTARKKPRHRGGRRHTRRPDAPKTEE